jgi:hypothetical protein
MLCPPHCDDRLTASLPAPSPAFNSSRAQARTHACAHVGTALRAHDTPRRPRACIAVHAMPVARSCCRLVPPRQAPAFPLPPPCFPTVPPHRAAPLHCLPLRLFGTVSALTNTRTHMPTMVRVLERARTQCAHAHAALSHTRSYCPFSKCCVPMHDHLEPCTVKPRAPHARTCARTRSQARS